MTSEFQNKKLEKGHPIQNYLDETLLIHSVADDLIQVDINNDFQKFYNLFNQLATIEKRFERKENQLFPFLEQKCWTGPSQNMWSFHDIIRQIFRIVRQNIEDKNLISAKHNTELAIQNINRLLEVEETVLFPNALEILSDDDWKVMRKGEDEIGWMLADVPQNYPNEPEYIHPSQDTERRTEVVFDEKAAHYDEGYMTVEQANLLFKTLPIDLTYVDENDKVIFYNRGEERVFPRSAGIIGREVRFCHPPKSVDTVLKILEAFRKGEQNEASFWINYKDRLIYIRYFAVRNSEKEYKGVIEISQDITDIKQVDGEKRLLEWK
ncbi:PAS domain-containing protein [Flavobacterium sp. SUN046]|uniref:PAS domain-containing protein n=1 Tax=Flavobacterium sp. SUN046 TaxID=3002440 RepID=UPI002DB79272|nr:PAS domain-containing protein [Flavobacterium sp. SUN046]MEC4050789.1 PAS domain-containing protein [Flavobacterium sp. SUN046]